MNSKSTLSKVQAAILVGAVLYFVCPDLFIGPIDDTVVALIAGIAEVIIGFTKSRIPAEPEPIPGEWEDF